MGSLFISLTSPEHLEFDITFGYGSDDFKRFSFYENLRKAWSPWDIMTTHSATSRLQGADINIAFMYG